MYPGNMQHKAVKSKHRVTGLREIIFLKPEIKAFGESLLRKIFGFFFTPVVVGVGGFKPVFGERRATMREKLLYDTYNICVEKQIHSRVVGCNFD